ncbi:MMPL family transporter [Hyunsoonleella sp. SJ7]|uniref:MMPL family transporter n=1 Tax=Hyunsoonleella aquatilis TaxID=2762758 RepID=A0A923KKV3_9FLAO|nr:MMPL family transporter [Hyunsoonleella aquatilis]MBC3757235.1 MMPL family transporter [Hyunsoonleella aquatilis]
MIKLWIKYRYILLVIVIALTVFSLSILSQLKFNTDFSHFFSENDPEYTFYKEIKPQFGDTKNIIVVGLESQKPSLDKAFLETSYGFIDSLKHLSEIRKVSSLMDLSYPYDTFFGLTRIDYLNKNDSAKLETDIKKVFDDYEWTQYFINKEGNTLFIWLEVEDDLDKDETVVLLNRLKHIRESLALNSYIMGDKYLEASFKDLLAKEIKSFTLWFFVFLIVSLVLIFRKFIAIVFPLIVVSISLIIFLGGMTFFNRPLGIMANLFPVIILIIGISDVIHMSFKYNVFRANGIHQKKAIHDTLKEIGQTTFITSFTTAVGFFVMYISPMPAIREFGFEAGLSILLAYILTISLVPIFFLVPNNNLAFSSSRFFENLSKKVINKARGFQNHPKKVIATYFILSLISIVSIFKINTNNFKLSNVPMQSELAKNYSFFEKKFGGSRDFELLLLAKENVQLNNPEILKMGLNIQNYLDSLEYINSVKSPILFYKLLHRAYRPSDFKTNPVPVDKKSILKYDKDINTINTDNYLFNKTHNIYKFSGRMKDLGRLNVAKRNNEILNHVNTLIDIAKVEVRLSGRDYLIDRAHQERIKNMFYGLILAIITVAITLGFIYKNVVLVFLTLLLNLIPILIVAGTMGLTGLELRGATSIIFTIGFVIAIDDTIHFLSSFQLERKKGSSVEYAISKALEECGKAILGTSLILVGGFGVLVFSDFMEVFTLGILIGITVFITLTVDLILAPVMMLNWFKKYI